MKTIVWVRTSFVAYHCWTDAPTSVVFLRAFHRHVFEVEMGVLTTSDRQIEFFTLQTELNTFLSDRFLGQYFNYSCETIAESILLHFNADYVKVSEDGENGATVER